MNAKAVYDSWVFSLYVQAGIKRGAIPRCAFNKELTVKTNGKKDVVIRPPKHEAVDIDGIADNLRVITMGTCFIAFDEALDQVFGKKPETYSDSDIDSLRAIIYMMRCAFAHTPASPKWCIKTKNRRIFSIKEINFVIDFSQLNGKRLSLTCFSQGVFILRGRIIAPATTGPANAPRPTSSIPAISR